MKTIKDIMTIENGIFTVFQNNFATDFENLFLGNTAQNLNLYVIDFFGDKILRKNINSETLNNILVAFISVNLAIWNKLNNVLLTSYNFINSENETKTKTGFVSRENTENTENTDFEKVFNDTEFVGSNKETNTNVSENTDTYNLTETTTKNNTPTANTEKEFLFRQQQGNLQISIIKQLVNYITIDIY